MDYVRITWGDKIGLYRLTSSYTDEPYLRVSDSYLPLTTNTSNLIGETQPKLIMNGFTYRPLRAVESSSSTSFLTTATSTGGMHYITELVGTVTTSTIYHTCSSTSSTEYLTRSSTSRTEYGTKSIESKRYVKITHNIQQTNGTYSAIQSTRTILWSGDGVIKLSTSGNTTSHGTVTFRISVTTTNASKPISAYDSKFTSTHFTQTRSSSKNGTKSTSSSYTTPGDCCAWILRATRDPSWVNNSYTDYWGIPSIKAAIEKYNNTQNVNYFHFLEYKTSYTSGSARTSIFCDTRTVSTTGTTYYTCESTSSTIYHTRSSTSLIEYLTETSVTGYSGISSISTTLGMGWV